MKQVVIGKYTAIETLEREAAEAPSKMVSFYFSNKNYTINFTYYNDHNTIKDALTKVLSTLKFTQ